MLIVAGTIWGVFSPSPPAIPSPIKLPAGIEIYIYTFGGNLLQSEKIQKWMIGAFEALEARKDTSHHYLPRYK
jgi:hypothetical protein